MSAWPSLLCVHCLKVMYNVIYSLRGEGYLAGTHPKKDEGIDGQNKKEGFFARKGETLTLGDQKMLPTC